jgi:hypothetical protein
MTNDNTPDTTTNRASLFDRILSDVLSQMANGESSGAGIVQYVSSDASYM